MLFRPQPPHPHWRACLLVCGAWQLFPFRALAGSFDCNWQHLVRHVWRTRPASFYKQQYLNKGFRNIAHVSFFCLWHRPTCCARTHAPTMLPNIICKLLTYSSCLLRRPSAVPNELLTFCSIYTTPSCWADARNRSAI